MEKQARGSRVKEQKKSQGGKANWETELENLTPGSGNKIKKGVIGHESRKA